MARQSRIQNMSSNAGSLRILLADDHDVMRQGNRMLIERLPGRKVCGLASTGREAVAQADELNPNVVIMDMTMPEMNGLDAAIEIKRRVPESEILMFTAHEDEDLVQDAFEAGIKSVVFKSEAYDFLVKAIIALSEHQPFFAPRASEILFSKISGPTGTGSERRGRYSRRGGGSVELVAEGKRNKTTREKLGSSRPTG